MAGGVFGVDAWGTTAFGMPGGPGDADLFAGMSLAGAVARAVRRYPDVSGAIIGAAVPESQHWHALFAAMELGDVAAGEVLANLIGRVNATGTVHLAATLAGNASDSGTFHAGVMAAWQLLLEDGITSADSAAANVRKLAGLIDALAATGQAQGNLAAFAACTSAIALEGLLSLGYAAEAVDTAVLTESALAVARLLGPLVDDLMVSASGAAALRVSLVSADSLEVGDDLAATLSANADLADGLLLYANLRLDGTDYVGWALNTELRAASEHRGRGFDALVSFKGKDYGAGPGGLVHFTGTSEDGEAIAASIRTALYDFGTSKWKRVPEAFIGTTADGQLVLKTITREPQTGNLKEDWYLVQRVPDKGPGTGRAKIGRGLKSTWWQFELCNANGADFATTKIELRPLILDRRT